MHMKLLIKLGSAGSNNIINRLNRAVMDINLTSPFMGDVCSALW